MSPPHPELLAREDRIVVSDPPRSFPRPHWRATATPATQVPPRPVVVEDLVSPNDIAGLDRQIDKLTMRGVCSRRLGWIGGRPLCALSIAAAKPTLRVVVTAGVHGIEPAGPAAVLLFLEQVLQQPRYYDGVEITAVPLVNPVGYHTRSRGNADRVDLNRAFTDDAVVPREVALLRNVLQATRYDLGVDLHSSRSSGRRGYFTLHRDALDLLAPAMQHFGERYPVLGESTERYAFDAKGVFRSSNRGTLKDYFADSGVRWAVTVESPASLPYAAQVCGTADIIHTLIATALARV